MADFKALQEQANNFQSNQDQISSQATEQTEDDNQ